jgi:hypothetical protein
MKRLASLTAAVGRAIGPREAGLLIGLGLLGYGASLVYWPAGFMLPATVLLYVVIAGLR